jgi:hypothetical protein
MKGNGKHDDAMTEDFIYSLSSSGLHALVGLHEIAEVSVGVLFFSMYFLTSVK